MPTKLVASDAADVKAFDSTILVFSNASNVAKSSPIQSLGINVENALKADPKLDNLGILLDEKAPGSKVFFAPTGSLFGEVDDVRKYADAAKNAVKKAKSMGSVKPLVVFADVPEAPKSLGGGLPEEYAHYPEVSLFGMLQELYEPLQAREYAQKNKSNIESVEQIGVLVSGKDKAATEKMLKFVDAVEQGKRLARDITGADPERGAPKKCAEMIKEAFGNVPSVKVSVMDDYEKMKKDYPLLAAVARASMPVEAHHPVIVRLDYKSSSPDQVKENLYWVGKGITYDTGGADVKTGGYMRSMSRDKGGAGTVAGVMLTLGLLGPKNINATAWLAFVRNSIGSHAYVSDEIIESRAGKRVLVINTDAEGRMVMGDLLAEAKEEALKTGADKARLFTVATLTGHVIRAYGHYPATVDNGTAKIKGIGRRINEAGANYGDPWEYSTLKPEDLALIQPGCNTCDVIQADEKPSTMTARGHQFPAVFLSIASGLDAHGRDSDTPIAYTHLDIAGATEESPKGLSLGKCTGGPVTSLVATFVN